MESWRTRICTDWWAKRHSNQSVAQVSRLSTDIDAFSSASASGSKLLAESQTNPSGLLIPQF